MRLADYHCAAHGPFEALAPSDVDAIACPRCGLASEWLPSPVLGRLKQGEVSRGASDARPFPHAMDTRALADGMPLKEWKAARRKVWHDHDYAKRKAKL